VADSNLPEEIRNKKVLVVEGKDDIGFFVEVLKKQNILGVYVTGLGVCPSN
jgi:5S rRNA maturation endonuclease (ribonuclease M5)